MYEDSDECLILSLSPSACLLDACYELIRLCSLWAGALETAVC